MQHVTVQIYVLLCYKSIIIFIYEIHALVALCHMLQIHFNKVLQLNNNINNDNNNINNDNNNNNNNDDNNNTARP